MRAPLAILDFLLGLITWWQWTMALGLSAQFSCLPRKRLMGQRDAVMTNLDAESFSEAPV